MIPSAPPSPATVPKMFLFNQFYMFASTVRKLIIRTEKCPYIPMSSLY